MPQQVQFSLVGWRTRQGRFASGERQSVQRMRQAANTTIGDLKKLAVAESPVGKGPRPTGYVHFRDDWKTRVRSSSTGGEATLWNASKHAGLVIFPTKPHVIAPHRKRVLRFEVSGDVAFSRIVHHPGTRGNDVLKRVMEKGGSGAEKELGRVSRDVQVMFSRLFS